jgi:hypothetical protein
VAPQECRPPRHGGLVGALLGEEGGYEIRSVLREGEAYSYPGGVFPAATFERFYERVDPDSFEPEALEPEA